MEKQVFHCGLKIESGGCSACSVVRFLTMRYMTHLQDH